ncbi:MAG: SGNH/GDSL hydrolase family protein [Acutalibacteraceae bacterium]|nr:SGNH/GDSL hydrolase family protein [Acutalibacteraceae bacterium]
MDSYINLDKNMIINTSIGDTEVIWHNVRCAPFSLHGLYKPETEPFFHRLPFDVAVATSEGVDKLSQESTGARVRFSTNSPYIAIRVKYRVVGRSPHLTLVSSAGFDLYIDGEFGSRFVKEFRMPYDMLDQYEQIIYLNNEILRSFTINFPIHAVIETLEIGLKPDAILEAARPYRDIKPMVFYGSSIVHGTAASRPGYIYPSIISRMLNIDFLDFGFSGQAKGESVLAHWLATLPMSVFICDYDHNAPTVEHLEATHYSMYKIIREKNPELPYIMISRPDYWTQVAEQPHILKRRDVIMSSYLKARQTGDENIYFIDGLSFFVAPHQYDHSMDGIHPNDVGFLRMADSIGTVIRHIFEKKM